MKKKIILYSLACLFVVTGCKKDFLDITPESTITPDQLSTSAAATMGTLKGIYAGIRSFGITNPGNHEDYGHKSVLSTLDLMGHDVVMEGLNWHGFNYNYTARVATNSRAGLPWLTYYTQIKNANTIINSIAEDEADAELKQIRGQALALRGYFHFMLARIYGPTYVGNESALSVPINAETTSLTRNTVAEVYTQIISDLETAVSALEGYSRPSNEMIDQSVAEAFLAQVYLEVGRYADAAQMANNARQGYTLLSQSEWENGFYDFNQNETMWGADLNAELTSFVANFFSHFDNTNTGYAEGGNISIDRRLYDAIPSTDFRKASFAGADSTVYDGVKYGPYMSFKFRDLTSDRTQGDYIFLRSAEMYYIEAEGLARSGNEGAARNVLYEITSERDPGYVLSTNSGQALIDEIILQKRIEMWLEGSAWFDLKRLGQGLTRDYSGTNHPAYGRFNYPVGSSKFLFMIPQSEIDANEEIGAQNPE